MLDFFKLFRQTETSKDTAKERLQFVLVHDRANVSPQLLDKLKNELIGVLSKYMIIDNDELQIEMTRVKTDDGERLIPALVANIPIKQMKQH